MVDIALVLGLVVSITLLLILFIFCGSVVWALYTGAPWVPTRGRDVARMVECAGMHKDDVFYDLGCGDGRTLHAVLPYVKRAVGIEIALPNALWCWLRALGEKRVRIIWKSFFRVPINDATIVYIYQLPSVHVRLREKLERELSAGARVITHVWPIIGWDDKLIATSSEQGRQKFYVYKV